MDFKQLSLEEYRNLTQIPFLEEQRKSGVIPYLEECLQNNIAEYYIVNYNNKKYSFWFYKKEYTVDFCFNERNSENPFDNETIARGIFEFLQNKGYQKVIINLQKEQYLKRQYLFIKYGFEKTREIKYETKEFIECEKIL